MNRDVVGASNTVKRPLIPVVPMPEISTWSPAFNPCAEDVFTVTVVPDRDQLEMLTLGFGPLEQLEPVSM